MLNSQTLDLEEALSIIAVIRRQAEETVKKGNDKPIAIAVAGADGRLIAFVAMDGVIPVSVQLAINKAHTAIVGSRDTVAWENMGVDAQNFTDPQFTRFGGGVLIHDKEDKIVGAIGVSGRKSQGEFQDHDLADFGRVWFRRRGVVPG